MVRWSLYGPEVTVWSLCGPEVIVWSLCGPEVTVWRRWSLCGPETALCSRCSLCGTVVTLWSQWSLYGPEATVWSREKGKTARLGISDANFNRSLHGANVCVFSHFGSYSGGPLASACKAACSGLLPGGPYAVLRSRCGPVVSMRSRGHNMAPVVTIGLEVTMWPVWSTCGRMVSVGPVRRSARLYAVVTSDRTHFWRCLLPVFSARPGRRPLL